MDIGRILENILTSLNITRGTSFDVFAIIDIGFTSYIIYKALLWVRETRAWSLFKGIVVLILTSIISYTFNLYTVSWIISNTFNVGIIAIIIIFQPEIRKMLEKLGSGRLNVALVKMENSGISAKNLDEILVSIDTMRKSRTGALIVLEDEVPLGEHVSTGVPLDAKITSQLIVNIFEDKTPLHDGAIIIKNNEIAAASCILPLTNKEIGKSLGTRHRAGVGVSEYSDAFVLILSEETGALSLAHKGILQRNIKEEDVRKIIRFKETELVKKKKKKRKRKKIKWGKEGGK